MPLTHPSVLRRLAANRRRRMVNGRPVFNLTREELKASSAAAMRLAGYRKEQA